MSDPFSDAHRKTANAVIRKQAADEAAALPQAAKARMTANAEKRKQKPNADIVGIPDRPKFYQDQNIRQLAEPQYDYVLGPV